MAPILLSYLVWLPAILGIGTPLIALHRRLAPTSDSSTPLLVVAAGMLGLGTAANIANLAIPVGPSVAVTLLAVGWALFLLQARRILRLISSAWPYSTLSLCILTLVLLTWTAYVARKPSDLPYDAGLYHLQSIKWITQSQLPLGLANLHGRFGFNSIWFSVSAALELPFLTGKGVFIVNGLLYAMYGLAAATSLALLGRSKPSVSGLFLGISAIVWLLLARQGTVGSASTDLPTALLGLTSLYLLIRALEREKDSLYYASCALVIAIFQVCIKFSGLVLLLTPAVILASAIHRRHISLDTGDRSTQKMLAASMTLGLCVLLPWEVRGIALSGYVAYPVPFGRIGLFPWTVPASLVENEQRWIMSWARKPGAKPDQVLGNWDWLQPWFNAFTSDGMVRLAAAFLAAGAVLWLLAGWRNLATHRLATYLVPLSLPILGLCVWFFAAPDVRFGWAHILGLGLLSSAVGAMRLQEAYHFLHSRASVAAASLLIAVLLAAASLITIRYFGPVNSSELLSWPSVPATDTVGKVTESGYLVLSPEDGDQCWDADIPCTPYFRQDLIVIADKLGKASQFRIP